jgi:hypothetical protein
LVNTRLWAASNLGGPLKTSSYFLVAVGRTVEVIRPALPVIALASRLNKWLGKATHNPTVALASAVLPEKATPLTTADAWGDRALGDLDR